MRQMGRRVWAMGKLAAMLGPWSNEAAPIEAARSELRLDLGDGRTMRAYDYRPPRGEPLGAYLLAPGLHYLGPDDPRCDRFCRALAASGLNVLAPFLPDYLALRISPRAADDLQAAWDALEARANGAKLARPAIFSISFGSQPAIALATRPKMRARVGGLVLFGGFADFDTAVRFAVTGRDPRGSERLTVPFDPLNTPVVFLHLLPHLDAQDRDALAAAWREMVERTWGREDMKRPGARDPTAHEIAARLLQRDRELFLVGCGLREGGPALVEEGLARATDDFAFADPRPHLAALRAPLAIVHGRNDDVIPWLEAEKIRAALAPGHPCRMHITGLYGHTGKERPGVRDLGREVATMVELLRTLVDAPLGRL